MIRAATVSDAQQVAEIYNTYVDRGGATFDAMHWKPEAVGGWFPPDPPSGWYVADDDSTDRLIGWASVRPISDRFGYRYSAESAIYLAPQHVGGGTADDLQRRLHRHCREHQIHHLMAKIISDNARSLAFHQRHGFETVGVQREIGRVNDRWADVTILQKLMS